MLDEVFEFVIETGCGDEVEAQAYFDDPPPGIDPVDCVVIGQEGLFTRVEMKLEDFVRNSIQFDEDPYDVLRAVRDDAGAEAAAAATEFLKTNEFTVAHLDTTEGSIKSDQLPTNPDM